MLNLGVFALGRGLTTVAYYLSDQRKKANFAFLLSVHTFVKFSAFPYGAQVYVSVPRLRKEALIRGYDFKIQATTGLKKSLRQTRKLSNMKKRLDGGYWITKKR